MKKVKIDAGDSLSLQLKVKTINDNFSGVGADATHSQEDIDTLDGRIDDIDLEIITLSGICSTNSINIGLKSNKSGDTFTGNIIVPDGTVETHAVNLGQLNDAIGGIDIPTLPDLMSTVPITSGSAGLLGNIAVDSTFLYVCVSTNTWKRITLETF